MTRPALYLETSALLRAALDRQDRCARVLAHGDILVTSELTALEAERVLARAEASGEMAPEVRSRAAHDLRSVLRAAFRIPIGSDVLRRARQAFPVEPVRSLDAVHLATLLLVVEDLPDGLRVLSTDGRIRQNAEALGFEVTPAAI